MHWPGTTAVLDGPAGFEATDSARAAVITRTGSGAVPGSVVRTGSGGGAGSAVRIGPAARSGHANLAGPQATADAPSSLALPCSDDPELYFAESPDDVESAKELCQGCAARRACLAGALERREPWGVWGGQLFLRGEIVPRKRPRGRPRKTDVAA